MPHLPDPRLLPPRSLDEIRGALVSLQQNAEAGGHDTLAYLIDMAILEAERSGQV